MENRKKSIVNPRKKWSLTKKLLFITMAIFSVILINGLFVYTKDSNAGWQPKTYLNESFWNSNPSTGNIIAALYGNGNPGTSAYNRFWTGGCNINISNVVYTGSVPTNTQPNTIYVLSGGNYNIIGNDIITMNSCSALVAKGKVKITKTGNGGLININSGQHIILDNLEIVPNSISNGIKLSNASQNTINNVEVHGANVGINLSASNNNTLDNIIAHDNRVGINLDGSSKNYINNSQVYSNSTNGIFLKGRDNSYINTNNNVLNNLLIFNNNNGISLQGGGGERVITITNMQNPECYTGANGGDVSYNVITNSQIFKNKKGIYEQPGIGGQGGISSCTGYLGGAGGSLVKNILNNNTIYNNELGVNIIKLSSFSLLSLGNGEFSGQIIQDSFVYNNYTGLLLSTNTISGSGTIYSFDNKGFLGIHHANNNITIGENLSGTYTPHTGYNISYNRLTNAVNSSGEKLITGTDWSAMRGTGVFTASEPTKYIFGKNIPKQTQPMRYDENNELELFGREGLDRDPNDYIASVNMEVSSEDQDIINYYYGQNSEFIRNRSGNSCSLGAFTVEYVDNPNDFNTKLLSSSPGILGHTIYVLADGNYDISGTHPITIKDNCVAIVNQGSGATIKNNGSNNDSLIKVDGRENIIINNLNLNGNNQSKYGILLEKNGNQASNNNTINNVKSYNHKENGITLGVGASYNNIMNTQTWNNKKNGIEIFLGGKYNIINNSLSYNNEEYGIRFGNISKYNTINNSQFFNNKIGGIFADFTTENNILNNIHTYNNKEYGLNFKRSSGNKLNNIYSYNNKIGINIEDTSSVNNKFNGKLVLFDNSLGNMNGTNGDDGFLKSDLPDSNLVWLAGELKTDNENMDCSWTTNPRIGGNNPWLLNIASGCNNTGNQSWNTGFSINIYYMFGLNISKQIEPVGYSGGNITNLDNQYNSGAYIGEINPIIWTDPANIEILSGNETNLDLDINHEMNVNYSTSMINHDFDVFLTIDDEFSGHLQIYSDGAGHNIGSGQSGVDFQATTGIKIVVTTPNEYYKTMTGILYIGTQEYGYKTGSFSITTIPDPTPPTIVWSGNIDPNSLRSGQANTWQATITGVYETTANYSFVTGADDCNTGVAGIEYTGDLKNIVLESNYATLNDKYVCVIAKDNINGEYSTALSNQIKISKMEFVDDIATGPVNYDIIDIDFQNIQNYGYRRVNSGSQCNNSLSGLDLIAYETPIVVNDISLNGKYMCVYGEDGLGSGKYMPSANKLNIIDYSQFVHFIDDVSADWVLSDTISVYFTGTNFFVYKKYKRVENAIDCNNSGGMTDYTGAITITNEDLNGKHFCLYSKEINSGIENYLVSTNKLKIDRTKPDTPTIISPINEQSIYWLIVETTGANDTQSGLSGFDYEIALDATFLDNVSVGEVNSTGNVFSPVFNKNDRKYSIRTRAIDKVGNKSERSNIVTFNYKNLSNFEFINVVNAQLGTAYVSNEITMGGLGVDEVIEVKVSSGRLFRNGNLLGTTGLVKNDDKLTIKMISSSEYDETVETKLTIANRLVPRKITTMSSGFSLTGSLIDSGACAIISSGDYLNAESILNSIVSMYTNPTQLQAFLLVMKSMLQDNIALAGNTGVDNMKCLLYLVDQYLITHFGMGTDPNVHKTPSCKEYLIVHNTEDNTYYSPNTIKKTKFGSRDELVKFLDFNNPGDCHINTYGNTVSYDSSDPNRHIAPNGKVYRIESNNLGYSSPDFINIKHFATINELRAFIDKNNPAIVVWDHLVDATFEPIVHTAPNDKTYKIYKTNRGYMSYKLIKVQYFDTLESLKNYINKNNQK